MIIQQDILAFLWNMGEVQIDEFEVFEGKEQNRIVKKYKYGGFLA